MRYVALVLFSVFGLASCTATPEYGQHQNFKADLKAWTKCIDRSAKDFSAKDIDARKASRLVLKACSAEQAALAKRDGKLKFFTNDMAAKTAYFAVVSAQNGWVGKKTTLFEE
ncbi:hypothetical protein [Rhizobium sp. RU36D]|uniref:hypothetical protein n=1 Tax=Rhizobium sp. RU36D TaxID=1907415 RepID=UPI0009D8892A|nr:hypothetical protein [Rhizobium sp. RU36D]SMC98790.1 hypothetical protein SAMN05880593_113104 [Rhizobium sp. RU36D]